MTKPLRKPFTGQYRVVVMLDVLLPGSTMESALEAGKMLKYDDVIDGDVADSEVKLVSVSTGEWL